MFTRESIEARIRSLQAERERTIAQANALQGAIEDAQWFLAQFDEGMEQSVPSPPLEGDTHDD